MRCRLVCARSICLMTRIERYVLMATEGLRQESIGKVRLSMREGLVGLVAAKEEPLNLERCRSAPQFRLL